MHHDKSTESVWYQAADETHYPRLESEIDIDIAVIGGGIAGMMAAYHLKRSGLRVAVVEKNLIASGTTAGTTGKITTQHGLYYSQLIKQFSRSTAEVYAKCFQSAVKDIETIVNHEKIDCDWQNADNFIYTTDPTKIELYEQEASAAAELGLPANFETSTELPFKIEAAVKFSDQAKFNAVKFVKSLAAKVNSNGSYVFENSEVQSIQDGKSCLVKTKHAKVRAKNVVVATKIPPGPLLGRFSYAAIEYPQTSYIVAGQSDIKLKGMYISTDKGNYSLLTAIDQLLIGGEGHIPGTKLAGPRYRKLAHYGQKHFGLSGDLSRWKAMDYIAYDKLPAIGRLYPWSKNVFVITGFKKWELTTSVVAAKIINQLILGHKTPESKLFDPHRFSAPLTIPKSIKQSFG